MQGGFETRPYKIARRVVVYRGRRIASPVAANEGEAMPRPYIIFQRPHTSEHLKALLTDRGVRWILSMGPCYLLNRSED